jgi:hypothetical protein
MPSKLDPHVATIEYWLAAEPQLTALAIVGRLSENHPDQFEMRQHSIAQRLLKALRKKAAEKLIAQEASCVATIAAPLTAHCLIRNVTEQVPANDWGGVTESGRCRRWREESAWARGGKWYRR